MLHMALTVVQYFCAFAIIGLVLIQRGKGAEAGAGFGAGASGTVFGARGAGTALSRATAILAAVFMINSLLLAYTGEHQSAAPKSILESAAETAPARQRNAPIAPARAPVAPAPAPAAPQGTPAGSGGTPR